MKVPFIYTYLECLFEKMNTCHKREVCHICKKRFSTDDNN